MPRKRPTRKLGVFGKFDINPENAVGSYIESKQQEQFFMKPPIGDIVEESLELFAIQNERECAEMVKLQEQMLENAKREKALNAKRINEMQKIQKDLRNRFIEVNEFIRNCQEKEQVAEKKIQLEKDMRCKLQEEITSLTKDIKELEDIQEAMTKTVEELEPYETTIAEVVEKFDPFNSVKDCMDRCDALMLAQTEISELEKEKIKSVEEMRNEMVKTTNNTSVSILGLINELDAMETSYNNAKAECLKWEKIMAATKERITENELTRNRTFDAIRDMYIIVCKRNGVDPSADRYAIEEQLDYIKDEIEILRQVVKACEA